jgi:probable phosphoglycerate mutase
VPIIHFVRHGSNEYLKEHRLAGRQPGISLNAEGLKQAQAVAKYFQDKEIKIVCSSPLERAIETAAPIADILGVDVVENEGLLETNIGEFEGQLIKDLTKEPEWNILQKTPSKFIYPGGESITGSQDRIVKAIKDLCSDLYHKDQIICVSHSDPIKLAVAYFIGLPLDNFQRLVIHPASITSLFYGIDKYRLITFNHRVYQITPDLE